MAQPLQWREIYDGGSAEAEALIIASLADDMLRVQAVNRQKSGGGNPTRTLHAKAVASITSASLIIDKTLPPSFAVGYFQPGVSLPVAVRLSNASGVPQPDTAPDMRGAALRVSIPGGGIHDLLMTSFPVSHARNAPQFVAFAVIASGDRETFQSRLIEKFGPAEAERMLGNIRQGVRPSASLALETFWSRGAVLWGRAPVRFQIRPVAIDESVPIVTAGDPSALFADLAARLLRGPVQYRLALQPFVDEEHTPIEDGSVEWQEAVSPAIEVATLVITEQDLMSEAGRAQAAQIEQWAFNPWNAPPEFRPLGNLNRARRLVYAKSAEHWQRQPNV